MYRGKHKQFEIPVALKHITKAGKSEADITEIYREIELLKSFNHPNIVKLLDTYETATDFCLVMELAEGMVSQCFIASIKENSIVMDEQISCVLAKALFKHPTILQH